jgi:hypothetical protein
MHVDSAPLGTLDQLINTTVTSIRRSAHCADSASATSAAVRDGSAAGVFSAGGGGGGGGGGDWRVHKTSAFALPFHAAAAAAAAAAAPAASSAHPQSQPARQPARQPTRQSYQNALAQSPTHDQPELKLDPDQQRAVDLVLTGQSVFITGVAGTGKVRCSSLRLSHHPAAPSICVRLSSNCDLIRSILLCLHAFSRLC